MLSQHRILLIQLYSELQFPDSEPLSIEILASALDRFIPGITRDLRNLTGYSSQLMQDILIHKYDVVGISVPQGNYELACILMDEFAKLPKPPLIVLGHALPTYTPQLFLERNPNAIVVCSWGEEAFALIVQQYIKGDYNWVKIPGIIFVQNGQIIRTKIVWPKKYTLPARASSNRYFSRVESSRGCTHDLCTFCTRPPRSQLEKRWMRFPLNAVIKCVEDLVNDGVSSFTFTDEDFIGNNLVSALSFAEKLCKIRGINFSISIRVDDVYNSHESDRENKKRLDLFNTLKAAGLSLVFLGSESLSNSQLKRYGKGVTVEDNIQSIHLLDQLGIETELGFILFDPLLSIEELVENIENLNKTKFWAKTGDLLRQMRIQENCAYKTMTEKKGLLKEYQPSTMSYNYDYYDPTIASIAKACIKWSDNIRPIYKLIRDIYRSDFAQDKMRNFIIELRELNFIYLLNAAYPYVNLKERNVNITLLKKDVDEERYKLLTALKNMVDTASFNSDVARMLKLNLDKLLD
jgi:hypothetical protein